MRNPGQILSQTQLLDLVWGYDFDGASNVVETYVRHLRRKIGRGPDRDRTPGGVPDGRPLRSSLLVRIAAIALGVMALTLLVAAVLTQQLIRVEYRQDLDRLLKQELAEVRLGLPAQIEAAQGPDDVADAAEIQLAVQRYLAINPGSDRHLTVIQIGGREFSTRDGPPAAQELQREGTLPAGVTGSLATVDSAVGPLRILTASLDSDGRSVGTLTVFGPLAPGREQAGEAFARIGLASAGGLLVGGVLLVLALRRALQPVHDLAAAARSAGLRELKARVPEPATQDEVATMAREFNRMLDRISDDERRRQQLLSAISHELRTPLAVARGHLELLQTLGPDQELFGGRHRRGGVAGARPPRPHRRRPVRDQSRRQCRSDGPRTRLRPRCAGGIAATDHRTRCRPGAGGSRSSGRPGRRRVPADPGPAQPGGQRAYPHPTGYADHGRRRDRGPAHRVPGRRPRPGHRP